MAGTEEEKRIAHSMLLFLQLGIQQNFGRREGDWDLYSTLFFSLIRNVFLFVDENQFAQKIALKKREIMPIFKENEAKIKKFLKENHFKLDNINEVIATLKFYEEGNPK